MTDHNEQSYHFTELTVEEQANLARAEAESDRAIRVRGRMLPLTGFATSLLLCLLTPAWYGGFAGKLDPFACLAFGILISLFAIPCHLLGGSRDVLRVGWVKSLFYAVGILINTAGTSLCMAAYYVHLGKAPSAAEMTVCAGCVLLLFGVLALLVSLWPDRYGLLTGLTGLVTLGLFVTATVFWIRNGDKTLWSLAFFLLLWVGIAVIALCAACSDEDSPWLRFASFASFGLFMIVAFVVLIILVCAAGDCDCDCGGGDCCDGCDCGGGRESKPKVKRRTRRHLGM